MKKTTPAVIRKTVTSKLEEMGFVEVEEKILGTFRMHRGIEHAHLSCASHFGAVKVTLIGGYLNSELAETIIDQSMRVLNVNGELFYMSISSFLGEDVDFRVGNGFGLSKSGVLHYEGALEVCAAEHSTIGGIAFPKNLDAALIKLDGALCMFQDIFLQLLPRLDRDLPFKDAPRYLYGHTGIPTLLACFARAIENGRGREQFDCIVEKLIEYGGSYVPGAESLIPILKKFL